MYKLFIMLLSLLFRRRAHTHAHICVNVSVCVCVWLLGFDDFWLCNHCKSFRIFFYLCFAFDFFGRLQLVDWESKTIFFPIWSISFEFVAQMLSLLLFLLAVCIADVRDGHSQELLLLVNVNKMSNVLQSQAKSGLEILAHKLAHKISLKHAEKMLSANDFSFIDE